MTDSWTKLKRDCADCRACPLCQTRKHLVLGVGREDAEVMLIGEGPGEQEDLQGEPFVGPAGKLLDTMLEIIDIKRENVYIANVVKCRPPHNRDPLPAEQEACRTWLDRQMDLIRPKVVVCLGRIAAKAVIDPDFRITRQHGQVIENGGCFYIATYHPSALLRDPDKRPEAFEDLMVIRHWISGFCHDTFNHRENHSFTLENVYGD